MGFKIVKNSNKICGIYSITLTLDGRQYIGSSSNMKRRWNEHKGLLYKNNHHSKILQNSWNKYGEDCFVFEILEECEPIKEILLKKEQYYIDTFSPFFNICKVAGNRTGYKCSKESIEKSRIARTGAKRTKEQKQRISESQKGKRKNPDHVENMRKYRSTHKAWNFGIKGENSHAFGVKRTIEQIINISNSKIAEKNPMYGKTGKLHHNSKKYIIINAINEIEIIICLKEYCRNNSLSQGHMTSVAQGKRKSHKGCSCFYYSDEKYKELLEQYPQEQEKQVA